MSEQAIRNSISMPEDYWAIVAEVQKHKKFKSQSQAVRYLIEMAVNGTPQNDLVKRIDYIEQVMMALLNEFCKADYPNYSGEDDPRRQRYESLVKKCAERSKRNGAEKS